MIRLSGEIDLIVNIIVVNIIITYYAQASRNTHKSFEYMRSYVLLRQSADNFFEQTGHSVSFTKSSLVSATADTVA